MKTTSRSKSAGTKPSRKPAPPKKKAPVVRTANLDKAIKDYEEALKVIGRRDYAKAAHLFEAIIKEYPAEREVCDRARIYVSVCRTHLAGASTRGKGTDDPFYIGVIAANEGRLDEAIEQFEKVLKQDPDSDKALYALATICGIRGDAAGAAQHLRRAIEINRGNRVQALNDSDFDSLRGNAEFMAILGKAPEAMA